MTVYHSRDITDGKEAGEAGDKGADRGIESKREQFGKIFDE